MLTWTYVSPMYMYSQLICHSYGITIPFSAALTYHTLLSSTRLITRRVRYCNSLFRVIPDCSTTLILSLTLLISLSYCLLEVELTWRCCYKDDTFISTFLTPFILLLPFLSRTVLSSPFSRSIHGAFTRSIKLLNTLISL